MTEQRRHIHRHAILIGINAYPDRPSYHRLRGCVHDVEEIAKKCTDDVSIHMFTATETRNLSQQRLVETTDRWPTYDNISSCLGQVLRGAQRGDQVYFHYSGHGTVIPANPKRPDLDHGDLALVVLEGPTASEIRYFRGEELAQHLKDMVESGVGVTLVLDCCHSGSILRNGGALRCVPYDRETDTRYPKRLRLAPRDEDTQCGRSGSSINKRRASLTNWLANPEGYAILASSDAIERSYDVWFDADKEKTPHGALTYFLLEVFDMLKGMGGTMEQLHLSIAAKLQDHRRKHPNTPQSPVLLGNLKQLFFGYPQPGYSGDIAVTNVKCNGGAEIRLHIGEAHGVQQGDRFILNPLIGRTFGASELPILIAEVARVRGITSDLTVIDGDAEAVETGWLATAQTHLALRQFPVLLEVYKQDLAQWKEVMCQRPSLLECRREPKEEKQPTDTWSFKLLQESDFEYDIQNERGQTIRRLTVADDSSPAKLQLLDRLQHLASFNLVRGLANKADDPSIMPFKKSFKAEIIIHRDNERLAHSPGCLITEDLYEACHHPGCVLEVANTDKVYLRIRNEAKISLFLYLFALGSNWEVKNMIKATRKVIPVPGNNANQATEGIYEKRMTLEPEEGYEQYEDVMKVILTAQPTSFATLALPPLGEDVLPRQEKLEDANRGVGKSEVWAAVTFRVRVSRGKTTH